MTMDYGGVANFGRNHLLLARVIWVLGSTEIWEVKCATGRLFDKPAQSCEPRVAKSDSLAIVYAGES